MKEINVTICTPMLAGNRLKSFWYHDVEIAHTSHFSLITCGDIQVNSDADLGNLRNKEAIKEALRFGLTDQEIQYFSFSLYNWFVVEKIGQEDSDPFIFGNYDEAIVGLILAQKEYNDKEAT